MAKNLPRNAEQEEVYRRTMRGIAEWVKPPPIDRGESYKNGKGAMPESKPVTHRVTGSRQARYTVEADYAALAQHLGA